MDDELKDLAEETAKYYGTKLNLLSESRPEAEYIKLFSLYQEKIARNDDLEVKVQSLQSLVNESEIFRKLLEEYMVPGCWADNHSYLDWVKRVESALK